MSNNVDTFDRKDLKIDSYRTGNPGGQHFGTCNTIIKVTHLPTGIIEESSSERSQHKNKEAAIRKIMLRLEELDNQNDK